MKAQTLIIALLAVLTACGPASKLKRAQRLIREAEAAGATVKADTVFVEKQVIVPEIRVDTVVTTQNFRDTIVVSRDRVVTRVKVDPVTKTVYIQSKCLPDTVRIKVPVTVTKKISAGYTGWGLAWRCLIAFLIGAVVGRFLLKLIL